MTKQELNRDIKRFKRALETMQYVDQDDAEREFKRLYNADNKFKYMNKQSVLFMLRINLKHHFISLHSFGLFIEL